MGIEEWTRVRNIPDYRWESQRKTNRIVSASIAALGFATVILGVGLGLLSRRMAELEKRIEKAPVQAEAAQR
jgi:hypothetical protein